LRSTQRISRYEIMWEREESLPTEITKVWSSGDPICNLGDIANTLHGIMASLQRWSTEKFGAVTKELAKDQEKNGRLEWLGPCCKSDGSRCPEETHG
jgi:hypothetical protein